MNIGEITPQLAAEVDQLFENFNLYAEGKTLNDMVNTGAPLLAAMLTVERAQSRCCDASNMLFALALGVYLAEIGQARLMADTATVQ